MQTALVYHPVLPAFAKTDEKAAGSSANHGQIRNPQSALEEAVGLAAAIELEVVESAVITISRPKPATLFGTGKLDEIKGQLSTYDHRPDLLIIDGSLTPVQHRNLEKALDIKVLDRTALILEIFGARAQTKEGRLQVELAHLTYQRSRLVRSWTHLERQRGGDGFLGGPGERQIESDRRVLADKIVRLRKKLEAVKRTRSLQRAKRQRAPYPVVALVGYTNAGKSTLFNLMTQSKVQAQDLLFATLDPTMRSIILASGQQAILSDTVGFISDLPTQLVASFRATLEEVLEADIIIHVRDIAHPDSEAQRQDVLSVLQELGIDTSIQNPDSGGRPVIEALNKIDLLEDDERFTIRAAAKLSVEPSVKNATAQDPVQVAISAVTGEGVAALSTITDSFLTAERQSHHFKIPLDQGAARAFLHARGEVMEENVIENTLLIDVRLSSKIKGQFETQFAILAEEREDCAPLSRVKHH